MSAAASGGHACSHSMNHSRAGATEGCTTPVERRSSLLRVFYESDDQERTSFILKLTNDSMLLASLATI